MLGCVDAELTPGPSHWLPWSLAMIRTSQLPLYHLRCTLSREVQLSHTHSAWLCKQVIHPSTHSSGQSLFLLKILADFATAAMMHLGKQHFTWPCILVWWSENSVNIRNLPSRKILQAWCLQGWEKTGEKGISSVWCSVLSSHSAGIMLGWTGVHQPHN